MLYHIIADQQKVGGILTTASSGANWLAHRTCKAVCPVAGSTFERGQSASAGSSPAAGVLAASTTAAYETSDLPTVSKSPAPSSPIFWRLRGAAQAVWPALTMRACAATHTRGYSHHDAARWPGLTRSEVNGGRTITGNIYTLFITVCK